MNLIIDKTSKSYLELNILVIAILIPVFLDYLPNVIDKFVGIIPPFNFKLSIVTYVSIFLGVLWFFILMIGLLAMISKENNFFILSFKAGVISTIGSLSMILFSYLIYMISFLIFGNLQIIATLIIIFAFIAIILNRLKTWGII